MTEVTEKMRADVKGGTLIRFDNKLRLLEIAQVMSMMVASLDSIPPQLSPPPQDKMSEPHKHYAPHTHYAHTHMHMYTYIHAHMYTYTHIPHTQTHIHTRRAINNMWKLVGQ